MPFNYAGTEAVDEEKENKSIVEVKVEDHVRSTSMGDRMSKPIPMTVDLDSHMITQVKQCEDEDEDEELK